MNDLRRLGHDKRLDSRCARIGACAGAVTALLLLAAVAGTKGAGTALAAFPGLNGKIAFAASGVDIYVVDANGRGLTNLTKNPDNVFVADPAWSPDGSRIAFATNRFSAGNGEIVVMTADGRRMVNLTNNPAEDADPTWSPDGKRIAFTRFEQGNTEIFVMNADGTGQTNLTNDPAFDLEPAWSPDRTRIAFATSRGGASLRFRQIFVMNADGSGQTNLTNTPDRRHEDPAWSPDGRKIAFGRSFCSGCPADIFVMSPDGSRQTSLGNSPDDEHAPAWSPNGKKIVYAGRAGSECGQGGSDEIFVMNADGSDQTRLTCRYHVDSPDWQQRQPCRVPNLVGPRLGAARTAIRRANCSVGRIRYVRSSRARGRVVAQSPRPGVRRARGAKVNLFVSRGPRR